MRFSDCVSWNYRRGSYVVWQKTNFNKKNIICEAKNLYILLVLLLITISLLISVSINFLQIKHKAKKKAFITMLRHKWPIIKCITNMDSNDELKNTDIKNLTCYYFDDIIKIADFNLDNSLKEEKSYNNIFVYNIAYKTLINANII